MGRRIDLIVIHCSASPPKAAAKQTAADIDRMHRERGWQGIGYHWFLRFDGTVEAGRPETAVGSHVAGKNANSIGVCYAGGVGPDGKGADTRSPQQRQAMANLIRQLKQRYPGARVCGHRDLSPDLDRDGVVERHEWMKECPSFDVAAWLQAENLS